MNKIKKETILKAIKLLEARMDDDFVSKDDARICAINLNNLLKRPEQKKIKEFCIHFTDGNNEFLVEIDNKKKTMKAKVYKNKEEIKDTRIYGIVKERKAI